MSSVFKDSAVTTQLQRSYSNAVTTYNVVATESQQRSYNQVA